jgi:hypothetical protein
MRQESPPFLEGVRAPKTGPPLKHDLIVLLTDGEEAGLLAAQAGIHVTGVLGILLRAKLTGEIKALKRRFKLCAPQLDFSSHRTLKLGYYLPLASRFLVIESGTELGFGGCPAL